MKVSLVMATVGRVNEVKIALLSLVCQTENNFELIIVDQNDDDRLLDIITNAKKNGIDINYIKQSKRDQSMARNAGVKASTGDIIAFPDDDCWYASDTIENVIQAFNNDDVDVLIAQWAERDQGTLDSHFIDWKSVRGFRSIQGCSMITQFYKREVFDKVGGFDSQFGLGQYYGAGEDASLFLSAVSHPLNFKVRYSKNVIVHHAYSDKPKGTAIQLKSRSRGTGAIYVKHGVSVYTVFRGIIAPVLKPLFKLNIKQSLMGFSVGLGRLQGFLHYFYYNIGNDNCRESDYLYTRETV